MAASGDLQDEKIAKLIILDPINKPWVAYCDVCGMGYENHAGSTPCCGSIAYINDAEAHEKES